MWTLRTCQGQVITRPTIEPLNYVDTEDLSVSSGQDDLTDEVGTPAHSVPDPDSQPGTSEAASSRPATPHTPTTPTAINTQKQTDAIRRRREIDRRGWSRERSQDDFSHHIYNPSTSLFDDTFAKRRNNLPETAAPQPPAPFIRTALLSSR
ncbi:hypothetical protein LSAT2_014899 [Lamellibrachia satsuma]|nr:hypothetical protein LSAT2_014899 [Lamellibrachia satsuma]